MHIMIYSQRLLLLIILPQQSDLKEYLGLCPVRISAVYRNFSEGGQIWGMGEQECEAQKSRGGGGGNDTRGGGDGTRGGGDGTRGVNAPLPPLKYNPVYNVKLRNYIFNGVCI